MSWCCVHNTIVPNFSSGYQVFFFPPYWEPGYEASKTYTVVISTIYSDCKYLYILLLEPEETATQNLNSRLGVWWGIIYFIKHNEISRTHLAAIFQANLWLYGTLISIAMFNIVSTDHDGHTVSLSCSTSWFVATMCLSCDLFCD